MDLAAYKARRPRRDQASLLVLAFVCSIVAHVVFAVAWEFRAQLPHFAWMDWLKAQSAKLNPAALLMKLDEPKPLPPELKKLLVLPPPEEPPMPQLTFVDVDPALASDPPKDAKFYSMFSARAANPDTKVESNVPKIDGKQEQFAKLTEVTQPAPPATPPPALQPKARPVPPETRTSLEPRPQSPPMAPNPAPAPQHEAGPQSKSPPKPEPQPLQPAPAAPAPLKPAADALPKPKPAPPTPTAPAPTQVAKVATEFRSTPALNPSTAKPAPPPEAGDDDTKIVRPRTVKEALARRSESGLVGELMKQEGGVKNLGRASLDVRGMSFGAYDAKLIYDIQQCWYGLIESRAGIRPSGKVIVDFRLHHNGRVTDVKVNDADVGPFYERLCELAVQKPAPFPPWPRDMRLQFQQDYRDVRFTFHYN